VAPVQNNVLQFAVGTANLNGTIGLNVVATYRQPSNGLKPGDSGTALNSPTLTIPGTLPGAAGSKTNPNDPTSSVMTGPGPGEAGSKSAGSTPQAPNSTTVTSFGQSGGVFGYGIEPFNALGPYDAVNPNNAGQPFQINPYPVPLYADSAAGVTPFIPWGGPPAFDILGNGTSVVGNSDFPSTTDNSGTPEMTAGVPLGIDVFAGVAPTAGTYTLSVSVPANSGTVNTSKNATMPAGAPTLGAATAPAATFDGKGGATFAVTMPTGATEAIVEIIDNGNGGANCNGASASQGIYYTIKVTASGTATLGDSAGPGSTPSICTAAQNGAVKGGSATGDSISVYLLGFDYPFVESSYPFSAKNPSPTITGSGPTDDITISPAGSQTST
jgi:hypothetical protein